MNTPYGDGQTEDRNELRYAEYVLGVLEADARAAVAREIVQSDSAAVAVALWQRRLLPLADVLAQVTPPPELWPRILSALSLDSARRQALRPPSLWGNLSLWRWIGVGASAVATACLVDTARTRKATGDTNRYPDGCQHPAGQWRGRLDRDHGSGSQADRDCARDINCDRERSKHAVMADSAGTEAGLGGCIQPCRGQHLASYGAAAHAIGADGCLGRIGRTVRGLTDRSADRPGDRHGRRQCRPSRVSAQSARTTRPRMHDRH